jgi:DNA-binding LacI/PurR family transcriptional regulator
MSDKTITAAQSQVEFACEILRTKIKAGELSSNGKIPSVRKLVDRLNCNRNAIWRALVALKEERYVTTTPTGRYLVHPRFQLNNPAQNTLKVAFVGEGESTITNAFTQGIYTALAGNQDGYNIQLDLRLGTKENQLEAADLLSYDAIILATYWSFRLYDTLKKKGKLVTSVVAPLRDQPPCGVQIDDFHGGELAGQAYCDRASERIVVLAENCYYPEAWPSAFELRTLGLRRRWLQHGKRTQAIAKHPLPVDLLSRIKEIERIVDAQEHRVDYFALSDSSALMLHSVLRDRGIKIPEQAQIISFDNRQHDAATETPSLSSIYLAPSAFSDKLVEQLRFIEVDPNFSEIAYIKPRLIARDSLKSLKTHHA